MRNRIAVGCAALLIFLASAPGAREREAVPLTAAQFTSVIERISEEGGYFWNDNFVSNEASYLHQLKKMKELGIHGGIYIGVGPNQNFTYIAQLHPRYAFIVDVRRQNLLEHLLFKSLFHLARDRREYLSLLLSRPVIPGHLNGENYTVEDMVRYFEETVPDPLLFDSTQHRVRLFLTSGFRLNLSDRDWMVIDRIQRAFFNRGLAIKYDYIPVPTFGEFLTEKDLDGRMQNFLNYPQDFLYVKRLQEENRIIPVTGDFAGWHALPELARYLKERNESVTVFYASNVEQYLVRNGVWAQFIRNAAVLPLDDHAVFIRAYWSNYVLHPEGVAGYKFTQILQWIEPFLKEFNPDDYYTYWQIVTTNTIKLH